MRRFRDAVTPDVAVLAAVILALGAAVLGNIATAAASRENCREIETLKARVREGAIDDYRHLSQTARLLHIEVTPEVEQRAREVRDNALRRYAPRRCSIWLWK